jgi:DNA-binding transcriptional LysR family regulator
MDALTLDQFAVFTTIVAEGSFAAAARRLNRAQSAITYAIRKLEEQSGVPLFDRSAYRPSLTEAGRVLLPRAQRIMDDVGAFRLQATSVAQGLEAELSLAAESFIPDFFPAALSDFRDAFPQVQLRITVDSFLTAEAALAEGWADLALMTTSDRLPAEIERVQCDEMDLVACAAPDHPLARIKGPLSAEQLSDHLQLILTSRAETRERRDYGVHAVPRWRLTDINLRHALLLAGVGWCSMPRAMVATDLAAGRLVELKPRRWEGSDRMPRLPIVIAWRRDKALGPAARWLVQRLAAARKAAPHGKRRSGSRRAVK